MTAHFLVVDDDSSTTRLIARIVRPYGEADVAGTAREAERLLEGRSSWSALFLDVGLPDGSGLDVLARARTAHPLTPAMILTGSTNARTINLAYDLGAHYVVKPVESDRIARFVANTSRGHPPHGALEALARRYSLSDAEVDILRRAVAGEDRESMASSRGTSVLTVRKQISNLLAKTGSDSFHALVVRCLQSP